MVSCVLAALPLAISSDAETEHLGTFEAIDCVTRNRQLFPGKDYRISPLRPFPGNRGVFFYSLIPFWRILALREKQQPPLILLRQKPGGIAKSSFVPAGRAR